MFAFCGSLPLTRKSRPDFLSCGYSELPSKLILGVILSNVVLIWLVCWPFRFQFQDRRKWLFSLFKLVAVTCVVSFDLLIGTPWEKRRGFDVGTDDLRSNARIWLNNAAQSFRGAHASRVLVKVSRFHGLLLKPASARRRNRRARRVRYPRLLDAPAHFSRQEPA